MCIYYSHWINLPDIFSSIKQNTQMPPLLLFSNCFIFSKRGTGSWRRDTFALCRSPCPPLWAEKREKAGSCLSRMGLRLGEGQERSLCLQAELLGFPELEGNGNLMQRGPRPCARTLIFHVLAVSGTPPALWKLWPCDVGCTHLARNNSPHILKSHYQPERPCCINYLINTQQPHCGAAAFRRRNQSLGRVNLCTDSAGGFQNQRPPDLSLPSWLLCFSETLIKPCQALFGHDMLPIPWASPQTHECRPSAMPLY